MSEQKPENVLPQCPVCKHYATSIELHNQVSGHSMYDSIDKKEAMEIVNACEWILKNDMRAVDDDGDSKMLESVYSGRQSFGCTDYVDHRADPLAQLQKLVMPSITASDTSHQRCHYYQDRKTGEPFKKIVISGYMGGYQAYFIK